IFKVENPSCLWGRVFGGSGETTEDYADLQTQMNLFYHDVTQDLHSLKPASFEEGQVLVKNYRTLSPAESYSWPAVARGCNTFIISQNADQPLGYLVPLLTHLLLNSVHVSHASSSGPIAVLLCPGWEKAQLVYDLLEETNVSQTLHPLIMLVGIGKDQAKDVKIPKNCLLLVTTPFSFVRLLSSHCFLFLRLYHLLLDEADELFTRAPDQMESILQHFQKVTSRVEKGSCPRQLIAAARRWSSPMEKLISCHMPNPYIVISVLEEAALYGNIQQVVLMTPENNKISVLLDALDFCPDVGQKTLIVANSAQEVEDVFQVLIAFFYGSRVTRSLLLVSERNARHVVGVLRYLGRTATHLPPVLLRFAERVCLSREEQKISRPLCRYLKSFGVCRDRNACLDRHSFNPHLDHSALPTSGVIEVLPLYIKTASVYYGRLVNSSDEGFESMASEINSYYADTKPGAKELLQGKTRCLYLISGRVQTLELNHIYLFNSISVRFVDIGKEVEVKSYQVLELPEQFHSLPHQAVEIVVCGVKPVDAEMEWHPKVTRAISQKIRGLQHQARVVLSLGNTLFVHHMVTLSFRVAKIYSLQSEILKTGMGVSNPEHLDVLRELLQDSVERLSRKEAAGQQSDLRWTTTSVLWFSERSFSPQVVWFQTCDSVIVTVKLMNPEVQQCDFYTDRVVYSGRVNGRSYRADLELHQNIAADACHWEMKSNQPILKLVKQEPGYWERLVRGKVL
uniref:RNA helicase n=1 Tax=Cyprinodon variegatus TaxID=28743 RepID=A0A3Q2CDJ8_CYPVA